MPTGSKDYYRILGVPRKATEDEIKRAYRKLARESHPDVARDKAGAEERFKAIGEAYEVLGDPAKRRVYDEQGADPGPFRTSAGRPGSFRRARARGAGAVGRDPLEEFRADMDGGGGEGGLFEKLFGRSERGFGRRVRGNDVEAELEVTLEEVLHGAVRSLTQAQVDPRTGVEQRSTVQVRIPAGVREGQMIRVAGRGEVPPAGEPGDLYLRVRYAGHPRFTVKDGDLNADLTLAPWEAILGATVELPTLDGSVSLRVPAGSKAGQKLRVRGRGLPDGEGVRGDLYVLLRVDVPVEVTEEERELWRKLAAQSRFRPRG